MYREKNERKKRDSDSESRFAWAKTVTTKLVPYFMAISPKAHAALLHTQIWTGSRLFPSTGMKSAGKGKNHSNRKLGGFSKKKKKSWKASCSKNINENISLAYSK
jgi:hypothetical protein